MADVRNILVGAAQLFVSRGTGLYRPVTKPQTDVSTASASGVPSTAIGSLEWTSGQSARAYLLSQGTKWRDVGYTNAGLEVSYEPGYNDVMVDQLLDAARLFKSTIRVMLRTELTEGTLENINLVFGQQETNVTYAGSTATTNPSIVSTSSALPGGGASAAVTLGIAAGALGDAPVERSIVAVGNAPYALGITGSVYGAASAAGMNTGAGVTTTSTSKERVYVARRVVQVEASSHGLKRDTATVFPVQFRCLPDDADLYDGAEYGVIIDRVFGAT